MKKYDWREKKIVKNVLFILDVPINFFFVFDPLFKTKKLSIIRYCCFKLIKKNVSNPLIVFTSVYKYSSEWFTINIMDIFCSFFNFKIFESYLVVH